MEFVVLSLLCVSDASKALEEHPKFEECQDQHIMQLYANSIQLEISSRQRQNAVDIANQLSKRFADRPSFSLMLLETLKRNSAVLQQGVVAEISNLVLLRSEECIYNYAAFLLAKVSLVLLSRDITIGLFY